MTTGNVFIDDLDGLGAQAYLRLRPSYPKETLSVLRSALGEEDPHRSPSEITAVDIGAGSGQFTKLLAEANYRTIAIEPSRAMRDALLSQAWVHTTHTSVLEGFAENTGLPSGSADMVTWAQCFHWLDTEHAVNEAARILRPRGVASAIWNQLDVSQPWVHRLTRIMRSGDVFYRQRPPEMGPDFSDPELTVLEWTDLQSTEDVLELGRTRSSYIRSNEEGQKKMQDNLHWYLYDRLGFYPGELIELPYRTLIWCSNRR